MPAVRLHRLRRGNPQRHAGGAARTVLRRLDRAPLSARTDRRFRTAAGQPDPRRRRRHAAVGQFRAVRTAGVDARRLRRRVRADAAGRHRRAISAGSLPAAETEALPLSQSASGHRRSVPVGQQHVQHARPLQGPERRDGLHRRCVRSPNIRCGRPRPRSSPPRSNWSMSEPAKAPTAGSPIPTASSSATSRRSSSRCARRISSTGTSISPPSTGSTFPSRWRRCWRSSPSVRRRRSGAGRSTISRCSPATVTLALLGNAFVCGVISGPHDRYGARIAWVATFVGADRGRSGISPAATSRDRSLPP